ncbi:MAG TPA: hypothetical protein VFG10_12945 [Saprospiraceae bacterium]|nr:hypothetical protein [Saprospiraceae bacterium]
MFNKYLYSILLLLGIISCAKPAGELPPSSELSETEKAAISEQVKEMFTNYYAAIKKDGLTAEFDYLDHSSSFNWLVPGATRPITYKEAEQGVNEQAQLFSSIDNKWNSLYVYPLKSDIAFYTGEMASTVADKSGNRSTYTVVESGVVIKRPDGWKLLNGQTTSIKAEAN